MPDSSANARAVSENGVPSMSIHHLRRAVAATASLALVATVGACSGTEVADDELVIGTIMPMSGPQQALSNSYRSMSAYFDAVNEAGGIDGVKIKLVVQDDQFNAVNTPAAVRSLVEKDEARMLCANQGSATYNAIAPYLTQRSIGSVPMSGESSLFDAESTGFQLLTPYELTGAHLVRHAVEEMDLSKIAVVYTDDGIGTPFRAGALAELDELGLEPVAEIKVNAAAADQAPAAARLRESGAEIVLFNHVAPVVSQLVRSTDRLGYEPQWGLTYATLNKQLADLSGDTLDGRAVFATPFPDSEAPELEEYRETMEREHPETDRTDFLTVEGWVVGSVCTDVIERAVRSAGGVPSSEELLEALQSTSLDNDFVTDLTWTDEERLGQRSLQVVELRDDAFETVADLRPAPDVPTE